MDSVWSVSVLLAIYTELPSSHYKVPSNTQYVTIHLAKLDSTIFRLTGTAVGNLIGCDETERSLDALSSSYLSCLFTSLLNHTTFGSSVISSAALVLSKASQCRPSRCKQPARVKHIENLFSSCFSSDSRYSKCVIQ